MMCRTLLKAVFFLVLLTNGATLFAQQKTVTGKITSQQNGEPLQGVSVTVKGTNNTVMSDAEGNFSIPVPSAQSVLVLSYVGFNAQEVKAGNSSSLSLRLIPGSNKLEEVVVIGYGQVKKRDLTGAVVSIKGDEVTKVPTSNAIEAIQGK